MLSFSWLSHGFSYLLYVYNAHSLNPDFLLNFYLIYLTTYSGYLLGCLISFKSMCPKYLFPSYIHLLLSIHPPPSILLGAFLQPVTLNCPRQKTNKKNHLLFSCSFSFTSIENVTKPITCNPCIKPAKCILNPLFTHSANIFEHHIPRNWITQQSIQLWTKQTASPLSWTVSYYNGKMRKC